MNLAEGYVAALDNLSDKERMVLKHWIGNTVEKAIAEEAKIEVWKK